MVKCDVCGEDMRDEDEYFQSDLIGIEIKLKTSKKSGKIHHEICRVLEAFGKTEFTICFACWLKSLGVGMRKGE